LGYSHELQGLAFSFLKRPLVLYFPLFALFRLVGPFLLRSGEATALDFVLELDNSFPGPVRRAFNLVMTIEADRHSVIRMVRASLRPGFKMMIREA